MNLVELDQALRQLRLSGIAAVLETRLRQAQTEKMAPLNRSRSRSLEMAGFEVSTNGRFCPVHRGP